VTTPRPPVPWQAVFALVRPTLSLAVAASSVVGYCMYRHGIDWNALFPFMGVLLLAWAASALNQYQEQNFDAIMDRTKNRPLPTRRIAGNLVLVIVLVTGCGGVVMLYSGSTTSFAALLGVFTLLWYNGVYTPLKPKTRFSVLIGALTGALPPLIGYTAAGGPLVSECLLVALFMFLWQISHFQLLLFKYGKEYERAGFRAILSTTDEKSVRISVLILITAAAGSGLLLILFHVVSGITLSAVLVAGSVLFLFYFYKKLVRVKQNLNSGPLFRCIYLYQGVIFILVVGSAVLNLH
jgi:heme o synthase